MYIYVSNFINKKEIIRFLPMYTAKYYTYKYLQNKYFLLKRLMICNIIHTRILFTEENSGARACVWVCLPTYGSEVLGIKFQ